MDPIELAQLPAHAQEKLRAAWEREARLAEVQEQRVRERRVRTLGEGAFVLCAAEWFFYGFRWIDLVVVPVVGVGVGLVWHHARTDRVPSAVVGVLGFWAVRLLCGIGLVYYGLVASLFVFILSLAVAWPRTSERLGA
jgi:hypothetical protein